MARLYVRSGLDPDAPDTPVAVLVADPDGSPGEQAVARLGANCHEGDEVLYPVRTDGWAGQAYDGGRLRVAVAVHRGAGSDPARFADRSAADPSAVVVLRAVAAVDPAVAGRLAEGAVVLLGAPGTPLGGLLGSAQEWPILLAPPPEQA
ncbi:hypothetical protein [Kitasatospora sp. NPDC018619]|uniref:hypothetical protein n=1 Tax=unclassified Kitasatospora TaxID=2633591 RepID=UPI0037BD69F9